MSFTNRSGETEKIQINAKAGDDIEELATYINGQTDKVTASVNEKVSYRSLWQEKKPLERFHSQEILRVSLGCR